MEVLALSVDGTLIQDNIGGSGFAVDLSAFAGQYVNIMAAGDDAIFAWAAAGTSDATLLSSADTGGSFSTNAGEPLDQGAVGKSRVIPKVLPVLMVKPQTGTISKLTLSITSTLAY